MQQLRLGLNYRFDDASQPSEFPVSRLLPSPDILAFHGQT
jgi:hypothetical protein